MAVTVVCSIVAVVYVAMPIGPLVQGSISPLTELDRPEDSLERLVTRELDLRAAMRQGFKWEWRAYRVLSGGEDPISEARDWYEELAETYDSPSAELHLAILGAESGEEVPTDESDVDWKAWGESGEHMRAWLRAAYLDPHPDADEGSGVIDEIRDQRDPDWFTDTLVARIAGRIGDDSARSRANDGILARGRALQLRLRVLTGLMVVLLALGVLALVSWIRRRPPLRVADAPVPPEWSFSDGYALFVRALGGPQAIILAALFILRRVGSFEMPLESPLGMAVDLVVFWWVARYLRHRRLCFAGTFGLAPPRRDWITLAGVALVLIGVALVSDTAIDEVGGWIGLRSHWADGFSEDILWDPRWMFALDAFNVTVWAPIVEELTFRGLLFATLRTRLDFWPSAFLSAAVFALPHGYAAAGSLSVLVSGLLWAWAYERTRSLIPGLLAHSANNAMSTLWVVGLLRW
jgi:hypothetical protein